MAKTIQCRDCRHRNQEKYNCDAFPNGIPHDILQGEFDHTKRHPDQDNDILFEPIVIEKTTLSAQQLEYILATIKQNQLPAEGKLTIKIGTELQDVEFRTGKDKQGLYIKTRQNLLSGWITANQDDPLFGEYVNVLIGQGFMDIPDIPKDYDSILNLTSKSFNKKIQGTEVEYGGEMLKVKRIGQDKYGLFVELDGVIVYKKFLSERFEKLINQIEKSTKTS